MRTEKERGAEKAAEWAKLAKEKVKGEEKGQKGWKQSQEGSSSKTSDCVVDVLVDDKGKERLCTYYIFCISVSLLSSSAHIFVQIEILQCLLHLDNDWAYMYMYDVIVWVQESLLEW